jgi:hypothetical protein
MIRMSRLKHKYNPLVIESENENDDSTHWRLAADDHHGPWTMAGMVLIISAPVSAVSVGKG